MDDIKNHEGFGQENNGITNKARFMSALAATLFEQLPQLPDL
ncbi:hypothetical protein WMW72_19380 [Paenibacillus filicis]|uniref:Uncharacterized protein n=1 Tax=Paenibacillus filicis TaxID=669464 RepID=A0ABU9DMI8_9BACL